MKTPIKALSILILGASLTGCTALQSLFQKDDVKFSKYSKEVEAEEFSNEMVNSIQNNPTLNGSEEVADFALSLTGSVSLSQKVSNKEISKKDRGAISGSAKVNAKFAYDKANDAAELTGKLTLDAKMTTLSYGTQKVNSETEGDILVQDYGQGTVNLVNKNEKTYQVAEAETDEAATLGDALSELKSYLGLGVYYLSTSISSIDPESMQGTDLKLYKDGEVYTIVYAQRMSQDVEMYNSETGSSEKVASVDLNGEVKMQFDLGDGFKARVSYETKTTVSYVKDMEKISSGTAISSIGLSLPLERLAGDKEVTEEKIGVSIDYSEKNQTVKPVNLDSYKEVEELLDL